MNGYGCPKGRHRSRSAADEQGYKIGEEASGLLGSRRLDLLGLLATASRGCCALGSGKSRLEVVPDLLLNADIVISELAHLGVVDTEDLGFL